MMTKNRNIREILEKLPEDDFLLIAIDVEVLTLDDDLLYLNLIYAESKKAFEKSDLKAVSYVFPKMNGVPLASAILEECRQGAEPQKKSPLQ
jgi:hypothetical protein